MNGATSATFTTPALAETTTYWVRVSNTAGAADSSAAEIKVTPAPAAPPPRRRRGRRAVDHRPAAASDDFGWTGRHVVRRSRRHGAADISVVFGDERSDGVADRWRHFVQLHDAVVDGDRELLGPRHEQRRHRGLDDGDDHDLGAAASFGHCAGSDVATAESDDFVRPIRHRDRRRERHRAVSYQWYIGASGSTAVPVTGATSASYTTPALTTTTLYWVRVSNAAGTTDSGTATITVNAPAGIAPAITAQPQGQTITSGQATALSVAASGTGPLSYQWYIGASGATPFPVTGATSASYTTPALTTTTVYWVRVSNAFGVADSVAATITVVADTSNAAFEDQVLVLVNQRRAAGATCGGVPYAPVAPLTMNAALRTAARLHSQDMAAQNYFSHTSLDGRTFSAAPDQCRLRRRISVGREHRRRPADAAGRRGRVDGQPRPLHEHHERQLSRDRRWLCLPCRIHLRALLDAGFWRELEHWSGELRFTADNPGDARNDSVMVRTLLTASNPRWCRRTSVDARAIRISASHRHGDRRLHVQSGGSAIGRGLELRDDAGGGNLRERRHRATTAASNRAAPQ